MSQENAIARAAELLVETFEANDELLRALPYAKQVFSAVGWARRRRVETFLRGLGEATDRLGREDSERLRSYLESDVGRQILADYVESALRARSLLASAALVLIYADVECRQFSPEFKGDAAALLERLSDNNIAAFLALWSVRDRLPTLDGDTLGFKVIAFKKDIIDKEPRLAAWSAEVPSWKGAIRELTAVGLLDSDDAPNRLGDEGVWVAHVGFSGVAEQYAELFTRAKDLLNITGRQLT